MSKLYFKELLGDLASVPLSTSKSLDQYLSAEVNMLLKQHFTILGQIGKVRS